MSASVTGHPAPTLIFYRRFNSRRESVGVVPVDVPPGASVVEYVVAAEQVAGVALSRRSSTTGVFEVQTAAGIWSAADGGSLTRYSRAGGCVARESAEFKTREQMEQEERQHMEELKVAAVEIQQGGRRFFVFGVDGKLWPRFATVSRIRREGGTLHGYQRPEALAHIDNIRAYMEGPEALVPNAVVFAFNSSARFEPTGAALGGCRHGQLVIPLAPEDDGGATERAAFIVDGQQRLAAVREADVASFHLAATGFITDDVDEQAEQFILVNSTKPLPSGLIYELLPKTHAQLPPKLGKLRGPASIVQRLNLEESSPLCGLIITATNPRAAGGGARGNFTGLLKETSLLKAVANSQSDGALHPLRDNEDAQVQLLSQWWEAVHRTWPEAWGMKPKESRLFHGAGVQALSLLMDDAVHELRQHSGKESPCVEDFVGELALVKDACAWTRGMEWDFPNGPLPWNGVQNTPSDVDKLARFLTRLYLQRARERPAQPTAKPKRRKGTP